VAGYSGDAGDAMAGLQNPDYVANGKMFTTYDNDNNEDTNNPAISVPGGALKGGWWYSRLSTSRLNRDDIGQWTTDANPPATGDVQASRMLIRINF